MDAIMLLKFMEGLIKINKKIKKFFTFSVSSCYKNIFRKLWIIMPPEEVEVLEPTRVPYEESSIYSSFNFYTPNNNLLSKLLK